MISVEEMRAKITNCDEMLARYRLGQHKALDDTAEYPTREAVIAAHAKIWGMALATSLVDGKRKL